MPRVFLIDTDTASDDAVALILALKSPEVTVAAITVVAGNVGVDQAAVQTFVFSVARRLHWCGDWRMPLGFMAAMAWAITGILRPNERLRA